MEALRPSRPAAPTTVTSRFATSNARSVTSPRALAWKHGGQSQAGRTISSRSVAVVPSCSPGPHLYARRGAMRGAPQNDLTLDDARGRLLVPQEPVQEESDVDSDDVGTDDRVRAGHRVAGHRVLRRFAPAMTKPGHIGQFPSQKPSIDRKEHRSRSETRWSQRFKRRARATTRLVDRRASATTK